MLKLSRNNLKCQNVQDSPPEHFAIGNVHRDTVLLLGKLLHYNMPFKTIAVGLMVLAGGMVHFLKIWENF